MNPKVTLSYSQGSLLVTGLSPDLVASLPWLSYDPRTLELRAPAHHYRDLVLFLVAQQLPYEDLARTYEPLACRLIKAVTPRPHQHEALSAWLQGGKRGVVCLPTGAGKTILAVLAMAQVGRPTLIVVPTIDLMLQWQQVLSQHFGQVIGVLGGGERTLAPLTVATYDSARLMIEQLGSRFGLLVCDECHHLPAAAYQIIAHATIAPFRLGLSATVERADGGEVILDELLGARVYNGQIADMGEGVLAPYDVVNIAVELTPGEKSAYDEARSTYTKFIRHQGINVASPEGWKQFIMRAARSSEGKRALGGYREQKRIAQNAAAKLDTLWQLLNSHCGEPMIVFTDDNALAYRIGQLFVLPVLTHKTKGPERKAMLAAFRSGELSVLVTSKVLNEGVDVPEAAVGVVVSGSGAVREHVQRLGRILRHQTGKRAVLYEVIAKDTSERYVNERRRQHHAYQRSP